MGIHPRESLVAIGKSTSAQSPWSSVQAGLPGFLQGCDFPPIRARRGIAPPKETQLGIHWPRLPLILHPPVHSSIFDGSTGLWSLSGNWIPWSSLQAGLAGNSVVTSARHSIQTGKANQRHRRNARKPGSLEESTPRHPVRGCGHSLRSPPQGVATTYPPPHLRSLFTQRLTP